MNLGVGVHLYRGWILTCNFPEKTWTVSMPDDTEMSIQDSLEEAKEFVDNYIRWCLDKKYQFIFPYNKELEFGGIDLADSTD